MAWPLYAGNPRRIPGQALNLAIFKLLYFIDIYHRESYSPITREKFP